MHHPKRATAGYVLDRGVWVTYRCAVPDVLMPGMDSLALQERLSAFRARRPVIFVSAHDDPRIAEKAARNGAVRFLHKPVPVEELPAAVHENLGEKHTVYEKRTVHRVTLHRTQDARA